MTDTVAAEEENRTYIPAKEVKLSVFYNLYIAENGENISIGPEQLDISSFNGIDYNCIKDAIMTNHTELLVKLNFPNIQIYYEDDGKPSGDTRNSLKTFGGRKIRVVR